MTSSLIVVFETDLDSKNTELLIAAIKCMRHVISVQGNVSDIQSHIAERRARHTVIDQLWTLLSPKEE